MADYYATFPGDTRYQLHAQAYESAVYIGSNESDVVESGWVEKLSGGGIFTGNGDATAAAALNGVGIAVGNWSPYNFASYSSKLLLSATTRRIAHNTDGTKTTTAEFAANDPNTLGYIDIGTRFLGLTAIPRGPKVEFNGAWVPSIINVEFNGAWVPGLMYAEFNGAWVIVA